MRFKVGEKVGFLKEVGGGTVVAYRTEKIVIVDDDGFDREFLEEDLVKIYGDQTNILHDDFDIRDIEEEIVNTTENMGDVNKNKDFWEIDLHTHAFMDSERGFTNGELLNRQLLEFKRFYRKATEKRVRKLIVIHGVGEGVLKAEIRDFLDGKSELEYYDSDYRTYGKGATTIEFFYS